MFRIFYSLFLGLFFIFQSSCTNTDRAFLLVGKAPRFLVTFKVMKNQDHLFFSNAKASRNSNVNLKMSIYRLKDKENEHEETLLWDEVFRSIQIYRGENCKGRPIKILNNIEKKIGPYTLSIPLADFREGVYSFRLLTRFQEIFSEEGDALAQEASPTGEVINLDRCSEPIFVDTKPPSFITFWGPTEDETIASSLKLDWEDAREEGKVQSGVIGYEVKVYDGQNCGGKPTMEREVVKSFYSIRLQLGKIYSFSVAPKDKAGNKAPPKCKKRSVRRVKCLHRNAIPDHANWKIPEEPDHYGNCAWSCGTGYKKNIQGTACVIKEEVTTFSVKNLIPHPNRSNLSGLKSRDLVLEIAATDVSHWYVTPDPSFAPKSTTDPAGKTWQTGDPTGDQNYRLPSGSAPEGQVTLYLWVADSAGLVKKAVKESDPFTLDVTPPDFSAVALPPGDKLVAGESNAPFNLTVTGVDAYSKYEHCFGQNCRQFNLISGVSSPTSVSLSFLSLSAIQYHVTFRVSDWLGNLSRTQSKSFTLKGCATGAIKEENASSDPVFAHGTRSRTCQNSGAWGSWTVTCDKNYHAALRDTCGSNTRSCPNSRKHPLPDGATAGTQAWDTSKSEWQACVPTHCDTRTYTFYKAHCYQNTVECPIEITVTENNLDTQKVVGSGEKTYTNTNDGQYDDCQVLKCIGGYDVHDTDGNLSSTTCSKTAQGFFSHEGDKIRTACSSSPIKPDEHAQWLGTGLSSVGECEWSCLEGYRKNDPDNDNCIPQEEITLFNIENLKKVKSDGLAKFTSSRTLELEIGGKKH